MKKRLSKRVKNSLVKVEAYCFEVLTRAVIIKLQFKLTAALNLMLQRTTTNNKLAGSYLRCVITTFY